MSSHEIPEASSEVLDGDLRVFFEGRTQTKQRDVELLMALSEDDFAPGRG